MLKSDAVQHYGTQYKVAAALGLTPPAVSAWREVVPIKAAMRLQELTGGILRVDFALYAQKAPEAITGAGEHETAPN